MAGAFLQAETSDLKSLLGNGKRYVVPPFQRDYAWGPDEWLDLWEDLEGLFDGEDKGKDKKNDHFMGALLVQDLDRKKFQILDGQQRMATTSVLILAAIQRFKSLGTPEDEARAELFERTFIGERDPHTLEVVPKLSLNETDGRFYSTRLVQMREPASVRSLPESSARLHACRSFFLDRIEKKFGTDGGALTTFVDKVVAERLLFLLVHVDEEAEAFTIFETLNARGVRLGESDLLKNHIFSVMQRDGRIGEELVASWDEISSRVGLRRIPELLRAHLDSRYPSRPARGLFRSIRRVIDTPKSAYALLSDLETDSLWFQALGDPSHEIWLDHPGARERLRVLNLMMEFRHAPLILAARDAAKGLIGEILRACAIIAIRKFVAGDRGVRPQELAYNRAAIALRDGTARTAADVRRLLADIYVSDAEFRAGFATLRIDAAGSIRQLRYFLAELERDAPGGVRDLSDLAFDATIEHVLPRNPDSSWDEDFTTADHGRCVDRLANYAPLEKRLNNRDAANVSFERKREVYLQSRFATTRALAELDEWTPARIDQRQAALAARAVAIWRLDIP